VFFHHRAYLALEKKKKKEVTTTLVVEVSSGQRVSWVFLVSASFEFVVVSSTERGEK